MKKILTILFIITAFSQLAIAQRKKATPKKKTETKQPARRETTSDDRDTSIPSRTVTVTSSYKPSLKPTAKINFSAASPAPDETLPTLQYNVPAQNLFFSYQAAPLKPLAADIDSAVHWENKNYLKAGFGNYSTPYLQAGLSFGDGEKSVVNLHAKYISQKGSLPYQQYSKANAEAIGIFTNGVTEFTGKIFFDNNTQYQYGFQPDTLKYNKSDIRQRFSTFGAKLGLKNKTINSVGINYNPSIFADGFIDGRNGSETNMVFDAPVSKQFGEKFIFNFGITADLTSYKGDTVSKINNNLVYLSPSVQYGSNELKIVGGFIPSWDNKDFHMLPNITAEAKINQEKFVLLAGWKGYYNKTNYEMLAGINPWLAQPAFLKSTRILEQYAGFKGSAGSHFTYNAKVTFQHIYNQPLFLNDTVTGKSFNVVNEDDMKNLKLHGELGYTVQEKFSLLAGATINKYSNLTNNEKAWGLLPVELNGSLRVNVLKDLEVKADVYFWDGARYLTKTLNSQRLKGAADLNLGAEYKITKNFSAWLQFNNLFNNKYQRWNQYEVLGFQAMGGVIYNFGGK